MNKELPEVIAIKQKYEDCRGFTCPRLLELAKTDEDGRRYFTEGDLAYTAMVRCNGWSIGLSDGSCPLEPQIAREP